MKKGSLKKYILPNMPYVFMAWACLKLGTAYRLAAGANAGEKLVGRVLIYIIYPPKPRAPLQI